MKIIDLEVSELLVVFPLYSLSSHGLIVSSSSVYHVSVYRVFLPVVLFLAVFLAVL